MVDVVRREHVGGAPPTALVAGVDATALSLTLTDGTNYPTGDVGVFVLTLDGDNSRAETVLASDRTGDVVTLVQRGYDNTLASTHDPDAVVTHGFSAVEADEANVAAVAVSAAGVLVGLAAPQALSNKDLTDDSNVFPAALVTATELVAEANTARVLKNKDLTDASNVFPSALATDAEVVVDLLALPQGKLAYAEITANPSGITTLADIPGLAVTFTAVAGRLYRVRGYVQTQTSASANCFVNIQEGATLLQLAEEAIAATGYHTFLAERILSPGAGSHTYKLTASASSGILSVLALPTNPCHILVEDIGLA